MGAEMDLPYDVKDKIRKCWEGNDPYEAAMQPLSIFLNLTSERIGIDCQHLTKAAFAAGVLALSSCQHGEDGADFIIDEAERGWFYKDHLRGE